MNTRLAGINGRRETIWLTLAAAEISWVTPTFLALTWAMNPHPPLYLWLGLLILMLGYFYLYRALVAAELTMRLQQGLVVASLLLSIGLVVRFHVLAGAGMQGAAWLLLPFRQLMDPATVMPGSWVAVMTLVYLWARAIHLANRSLSADSVGFSFRSGVVILVVSAMLIKVFTRLDFSGFVVAFFFFALIAVALARIEEIRLLPNSSPGAPPFSGFWIGWAVGAVGVLVLCGMALALFFYGGGLQRVLGWLSPVWMIVQFVIIGLGALFLMLLDWILTQFSVDLTALGVQLREALARLGQLLNASLPPPPAGEAQGRPLIFGILQVAITIAIPAAIIALVVFLTWYRSRKSRNQGEGDEARESLLSARAVMRNVEAMLQSGLDRLGELAGLVKRFGPSSRFLAAVSIRRIYTNLVRLAAEAGHPRAKSQTPYEFLPALYKALPGSEEDVVVITEAYVNAHYGQVPDTHEELQRIRDCWGRVRRQHASARWRETQQPDRQNP